MHFTRDLISEIGFLVIFLSCFALLGEENDNKNRKNVAYAIIITISIMLGIELISLLYDYYHLLKDFKNLV